MINWKWTEHYYQFIAQGTETCVSWDFTLQDWITDDCTTLVGEDGSVTCNCNNLTNFAVFVVIK